MKKLLPFLLLFLILSIPGFAQNTVAPPFCYEEVDGDPATCFSTPLKFPNGTLTENADGSMTYTAGSGSGTVDTTALWLESNNIIDTAYGEDDIAIATEVFYVDVSAANVGVGTSTPAFKFQTIGDLAVGTNILFVDYSAYNVGIGTNEPLARLDVRDGDVAISTNVLFVNASTGYVGIGTSNPQKSLDVTGQTNLEGVVTLGVAASDFSIPVSRVGAGLGYLWAYNNAGAMIWTDPTSLAGVGQWTDTGSLIHPSEVGDHVSIGTSTPDPLVFTDIRGGDLAVATNLLYVETNWNNVGIGRVGVGTNTPSAMLEVKGYAYINGRLGVGTSGASEFLHVNGDSAFQGGDLSVDTTLLFVDVSAGNVGIGTSTPSYKLDVNGAGKFDGIGDSYFDTNVGIGTSTPASRLDVQGGDLAINTLMLFVDQSAEKVGIGTSTPVHKVDIIGDLAISTALFIPYSATPTVDAVGSLALDTSLTDPENMGLPVIYDGTRQLYIVATTDTPADNEIPTYDDATGLITFEEAAAAPAGGNDFYWTLQPQQVHLSETTIPEIDGGDDAWKLLFDDTTIETGIWETSLRPYGLGNLTGEIVWEAESSNDAGETVDWQIAVDCWTPNTDSLSIDTRSWGATDTLTDSVISSDQRRPYTISDEVLEGDGCIEGDIIYVKIWTDTGSDTVVGDRGLLKAIIYEP